MTRDRLPITPEPGLTIREFDIPARDSHPIRIRSYAASPAAAEKLPLLIYLHAEEMGADLSKGFVLGGTSAGGNFTFGIAHLAAQEGLSPPLTGLLFLASSFCHPDVRPEQYKDRIRSVDEVTDAPGLTRKSIDYFAKIYGAPFDDKRLSPLLYPSHAGLAQKAAFYVCGWDPRRDEALLLDQILQEEGVDTKLFVYPGLPHGFWTTCPDLDVSKAWQRDLLEGVGFLLSTLDGNQY
ncbi:hypothetical protein ASPZODRAFT_133872 [Penicilliopsis zonata CBS 506.65]|uniref:Alpha/beta hydrolase fold-3 domain-containing protein n=1 Tax=Penicilliopsis zonata CBS 506.65 TaxID=1073090 RepID=A0A1L9SDM5_9EURO|nr:hypothetical protein ASPZODRAFT_133872 [Penicilliopsis zonata CBS 506.65]OJJ45242.1 hypothetical protein ASPZODRAFT_133872 [Penicilliopsis zonata CBS 506.65]